MKLTIQTYQPSPEMLEPLANPVLTGYLSALKFLCALHLLKCVAAERTASRFSVFSLLFSIFYFPVPRKRINDKKAKSKKAATEQTRQERNKKQNKMQTKKKSSTAMKRWLTTQPAKQTQPPSAALAEAHSSSTLHCPLP